MRTIFAIFISFFIVTVAHAQTSSENTASVQSVIENQINAFLKDDGDTAYSFAAPNIKSFFPNVDAFMSMVKQGYRPVYRPLSYTFGDATEENGQIGQSVLIDGDDGFAYEALYQLAKQPDGSWKITGVFLRKIPGANT